MSSEGGSPCSGTLARQGGSTPEALNPTITYIPYLSSIHLLPQHSPILDPHPLPTVAWTGTLGAWRTLSWAQGLSSWDSPCAELPQLGTALSGNQIFTRSHLSAGLGEREPLLCQITPVVPPGSGSCRGGESPLAISPPSQAATAGGCMWGQQGLQKRNPEPRDLPS